jgi:very-short-patch-repair endonuclease
VFIAALQVAKVVRKTLSRARALRRRLTGAETILWSRLRRDVQGLRFRRQHPIGPYIADFACVPARLVVEVDGATHSTQAELSYDARRDHFLRAEGWYVLRLLNSDVYAALDDVLDNICSVAWGRIGRDCC